MLQRLLAGVQAVLGEQFVGMYVHGSLATCGFQPGRSDVDFLVVTAGTLPEEMLRALETMHARVRDSGLRWATRLEGSYIPRRALRCYDPADARHPALRMDGSFGVDQHDSDWIIQRYLIREHAIVIAGPSPRALIDPVPAGDLRRAAGRILREWWAPQLHDHSRLRSSEYQAYAVLTMCRALYTLQWGTVGSKEVAARWAQEALGERWRGLIERASAWRHGMRLDELGEVLALIRYTLERAREVDSG